MTTADSATQGAGPRWNAFQLSRYLQWRQRQAQRGAAAAPLGDAAAAGVLRPKAEEEDEADSRDLRPRGRAPRPPLSAAWRAQHSLPCSASQGTQKLFRCKRCWGRSWQAKLP